MKHHIYLLLILLSAQVDAATVYKTVSPTGEVIYSDTPSGNTQPMELNSNLVIEPLRTGQPEPVNTIELEKSAVDYQLTIISPRPEQTIRNNRGRLLIRADLKPVAKGHFKLYFNQQERVQKKPLFQLENLDRGEYQFHIEYIGNSGKILASTGKQTFYLHKASALIKAN
ncbi:MAG: hypothetical protein ACI9C4_002787 [Paraglaciecola sp.]|jgi:hypothetical protein